MLPKFLLLDDMNEGGEKCWRGWMKGVKDERIQINKYDEYSIKMITKKITLDFFICNQS